MTQLLIKDSLEWWGRTVANKQTNSITPAYPITMLNSIS